MLLEVLEKSLNFTHTCLYEACERLLMGHKESNETKIDKGCNASGWGCLFDQSKQSENLSNISKSILY